jgi:transposase-like protein
MGAIIAEVVDTGEKRDGRGRRITPRERRAELVRAYRASGLTQAAFARQEGVKYPTFAHWVQQERQKRKGRKGSQKGRKEKGRKGSGSMKGS